MLEIVIVILSTNLISLMKNQLKIKKKKKYRNTIHKEEKENNKKYKKLLIQNSNIALNM